MGDVYLHGNNFITGLFSDLSSSLTFYAGRSLGTSEGQDAISIEIHLLNRKKLFKTLTEN